MSWLIELSSKIAFISSTEGGMDIEKIASENPEKIITTKVELQDKIQTKDFEKIISPFKFNRFSKKEGTKTYKRSV